MAWVLRVGVVSIVGALVLLTFSNLQYTVVADFREGVLGETPDDPLKWGRMLYRTRGCAGCHEASDPVAPGVLGPNLADIGARVDVGYLRRALIAPNEVIAGTCNNAPCAANVMPNYGDMLDPPQIDALVEYLRTLRAAPSAGAPIRE